MSSPSCTGRYDSDSSPSIIATAKDFYQSSNKLSKRLLDTRKTHRLDSTQYRRALSSVLEELYELFGQPVIDRLRELTIPE